MSRSPTTSPQRTAPIACSLDAGGLRTQEQRWGRLIRRAGNGRAATVDGVTLTFDRHPHPDAGPDVDVDVDVERELRELVAVETTCCAWARWEVQAEGGGLIMHASAPGAGVAVLQSMFLRDV
jgi:hypothetical protein